MSTPSVVALVNRGGRLAFTGSRRYFRPSRSTPGNIRGGRGASMESRRNFLSSRYTGGIETATEWFLIRGSGLALGCYLANLYFGDRVSELEEERQKLMREYLGESHDMEIEDLRENMWADVKGTKVWSDFKRVKMWSEKIWSSLKASRERRCNRGKMLVS